MMPFEVEVFEDLPPSYRKHMERVSGVLCTQSVGNHVSGCEERESVLSVEVVEIESTFPGLTNIDNEPTQSGVPGHLKTNTKHSSDAEDPESSVLGHAMTGIEAEVIESGVPGQEEMESGLHLGETEAEGLENSSLDSVHELLLY